VALIQQLQRTLEGLVSTDARIAASVLLVVLAGVFGLLVTPWLVARTAGVLGRRVLDREVVPEADEGGDWQIPVRAATRTLQAGLFLSAGLGLLVTWGFVGTATTIVETLGRLLPTAVRLAITVALVVGAFEGTDLLERRLESYAAGSQRINQHQERVVFRVMQVVLLAAVGLTTLSIWNLDPEGLLVGAGFLGIVFGMAARQTLGSFIAGFVIMFSRPFRLGDWVVIDDREGIVTDITIMNTRIKTFDDEEVVFPNDRVANATVTNRTRRGRLRLSVEVGVDYDADLERAESVAQDAIESVDAVRRVPKPQVVPTGFGDSAVLLELRFWIDNPSARRRWQTRAGVIRAVKAALEQAGIKIPFPQRELAGRAETGGLRLSGTADSRSVEASPTAED
jgi:small-conductance mechanosensitive channel